MRKLDFFDLAPNLEEVNYGMPVTFWAIFELDLIDKYYENYDLFLSAESLEFMRGWKLGMALHERGFNDDDLEKVRHLVSYDF